MRRLDCCLLTILASFCPFLVLGGPNFTSAQPDDDSAPWRIDPQDQPDLGTDVQLDLNLVSYEQLLALPSMTIHLANAIVKYRKIRGSFSDPAELRSIPELEGDQLEQILPYLKVGTPNEQRIKWRFLAKYQQSNPSSKGVSRSPYRSGMKLSLASSPDLLLGISLEKDPGESEIWDHSAMAIKTQLATGENYLILGDYLAHCGSGLVINTSKSFGWNRNSNYWVFDGQEDLRPYFGWNEETALRGGAIHLSLKPFSFSVFLSQRYRDANLDSLGRITAFDQSGLHLTAQQQERRNACLEDLGGFQIQADLLAQRLLLGATAYGLKWNHPMLQGATEINQTAAGSFRGKFTSGSASIGFETALDEDGDIAWLGGFHWRSADWAISQIGYRIAPRYFSPLGSLFDLEQRNMRNQQGACASAGYYGKRLQLSASMRLFRRLQLLPDEESSGGQDILISGASKAADFLSLGVVSRWTQEDDVESLIPESRWRGSLRLRAESESAWAISSRVQLCRANSSQDFGRFLYLGIEREWAKLSNWVLTTQIGSGLYDAPDYNLRLYWTDTDLANSWLIRPLWTSGRIYDGALRLRMSRWGQCELTFFFDDVAESDQRGSASVFELIYRYP